MRNFREEYRNELNQVPIGNLDADKILADVSADRPGGLVPERARRRRRVWVKTAAAAAIMILCSAGTVTAVNLHRSYIQVEEQGYTVSKEAPETETEVVPALGSGLDDAEAAAEAAELPDGLECEVVLDEGKEYNSLEEFRENEDIDFACPEPEWLMGDKEPQQENVYVSDGGDMVSYILMESNDKYLYVNQWDTRDAEDYGSSTVYEGKSANERTYVTESGFDFILFDSVENGETLSTHAVISLNGRELNLDFYGYSEETIESVLDRLELEIYLQ